jgi:hypothetical protein
MHLLLGVVVRDNGGGIVTTIDPYPHKPHLWDGSELEGYICMASVHLAKRTHKPG